MGTHADIRADVQKKITMRSRCLTNQPLKMWFMTTKQGGTMTYDIIWRQVVIGRFVDKCLQNIM